MPLPTDATPIAQNITAAAGRFSYQKVGLYVLLAALFTAIQVGYSYRHGRLLVGPIYDDLSYFVDGLERLEVLRATGKRGLLKHLLANPPHSPFSTGLAMIGFGFAGPYKWAPYVANGVIILGLLLAVNHLMAAGTWWAKLGAALFALSFPFVGGCITDFRPDLALGLVTAFGMVLLLRTSPLYASRREGLVVGCLAAAALLIKPTFAPFTLYAFALGWLVSVLINSSPAHGSLSGRKPWAHALWPYSLPVLVFALPYYLLNYRHIIDYVYRNSFGEYSHFWVMKQKGIEMLRYFWDGSSGRQMLGRHQYLVLALGLATLFLTPAAYIRESRRKACGFLILLGASYAFLSLMRFENAYFGATFYALVLFAGILLLKELSGCREADARTKTRRAAAGVAVALGLMLFRWPMEIGSPSDYWVQAVNRLDQEIYAVIRERSGGRPARLFVTSTGYISGDLLRYRSLVDSWDLACADLNGSADRQRFREEMERADFVLASEPGTGLVHEFLPSATIQSETLEIAKTNTNLVQLSRAAALNGKYFYVFARRSLEAVGSHGSIRAPFTMQ